MPEPSPTPVHLIEMLMAQVVTRLVHLAAVLNLPDLLAILGNCRRAMTPRERLLIVEMVLPAGDTPHPGKLLDMVMLTTPGGQERTEPEYAALLQANGFRLARVVPTASAAGVIEAIPL